MVKSYFDLIEVEVGLSCVENEGEVNIMHKSESRNDISVKVDFRN